MYVQRKSWAFNVSICRIWWWKMPGILIRIAVTNKTEISMAYHNKSFLTLYVHMWVVWGALFIAVIQ